MGRSALTPSRGASLTRGPRPAALAIPAISVLAATLLSVLPVISKHGWWPDAGLLMLLGWRLLRADAWPAWVAAPLGLFHDVMTAAPIGLSVALWPAFMLALDVIDRRTMWRDYWVEWMLAAVFIGLFVVAQWQVAAWDDAAVRFASVAPSILVGIVCFPIAAFVVARLDRWRMGR
jgi:rod shape-determining protein MreD